MGVRARHVAKYYQELLSAETNSCEEQGLHSNNNIKGSHMASVCVPEKWKGQIEKVTACTSFVLH